MSELRLIIAGSRDWNNYNILRDITNEILTDIYFKSPFTSVQVISGTARGADLLGEQYAKEYNFDIKRFPADWEKYGKKAGFLRNIEMAKNADACIVFWDGKSKGSRHMIDIAEENNLSLYIVKEKE
jgi:hypothetical protein